MVQSSIVDLVCTFRPFCCAMVLLTVIIFFLVQEMKREYYVKVSEQLAMVNVHLILPYVCVIIGSRRFYFDCGDSVLIAAERMCNGFDDCSAAYVGARPGADEINDLCDSECTSSLQKQNCYFNTKKIVPAINLR